MPIATDNPIAIDPIIMTSLHVLSLILDLANSMKEPAAKIIAPSINNRSLNVRAPPLSYQPCLLKKVTHKPTTRRSIISMTKTTKTIFLIEVGNLKRFVCPGLVECMDSSIRDEKMLFKNFTLLSHTEIKL